jgi:hypothetical protein
MESVYGEDPQYKYIMEKVQNEKYVPMSFENPVKSARLAGYIVRFLNWIRDHELQQLRQEFENAQTIVFNSFHNADVD